MPASSSKRETLQKVTGVEDPYSAAYLAGSEADAANKAHDVCSHNGDVICLQQGAQLAVYPRLHSLLLPLLWDHRGHRHCRSSLCMRQEDIPFTTRDSSHKGMERLICNRISKIWPPEACESASAVPACAGGRGSRGRPGRGKIAGFGFEPHPWVEHTGPRCRCACARSLRRPEETWSHLCALWQPPALVTAPEPVSTAPLHQHWVAVSLCCVGDVCV
jgi:hypothetical protein